MNIFVVIPKRFAGCGFYRLYQPHNHLAKNYDVKVTFGSTFKKSEISAYTDDELKSFDLIIWHKTLFDTADIKRAKSLGVPTVVDFDDHWIVNREHTLYREYTKEGLSAKLHKVMMLADYITCTTDELADEIYKVNQNVEVIPNAVDRGYDGWKVKRFKENKYVFGYLGGPCHTRDVALLRGLQDSLEGDFQFRLFGQNGTDIYKFYAGILKGSHPDRFMNVKGADIFNYPQFYNFMDCSLVPLENNRFNGMKSELKLIEAGAFQKAVVVSNVKPYSKVMRHGKNCLSVNNKSDWKKHCETLINNPSMGIDLGLQLEQDTKDYDIKEVNKLRFKFYQDVHKKHNSISSHKSSRLVAVQ